MKAFHLHFHSSVLLNPLGWKFKNKIGYINQCENKTTIKTRKKKQSFSQGIALDQVFCHSFYSWALHSGLFKHEVPHTRCVDLRNEREPELCVRFLLKKKKHCYEVYIGREEDVLTSESLLTKLPTSCQGLSRDQKLWVCPLHTKNCVEYWTD